jgi:hypothetical protein
MGRIRVHKSNNDRLKSHRLKKKINSGKNIFCDVCNDYIQITRGCTEKDSLRVHRRTSKKHRKLVRQDFPYWAPHEDEDDNVDVMEADEMVIDVLDDEFIDRTASPVNGSLFDVVRNEVAIANVCERSGSKNLRNSKL